MFTNRIASYYSPGKVLLDSACLSSDTKPTTGVANGSKCIEMDTGKTYMFNEEDSEWEELPSSGGGGGGSSDNMAILPKLTVTLNIDNTEHIDTYGAYGISNAVELNNGIVTPATFNSPQTSQVWENYIIPYSMDNQIYWTATVQLYDESSAGYYEFTISNAVNCAEDSDNPGNGIVVITDPTKPASCTMNAVYTSY